MANNTATVDVERKLRAAIDQDGLLDLFVGVTMILTTGLAFAGWRGMRNPGVFAGITPLLPALFFEASRKRYTYPRLGCPDYKPTKEIRFALIALTASSLLGLVVFLLTALAGIHVLRPLFEHAPVWAALLGAAVSVLLAWWYRSRRFLGYIAVSAIAVVAGYLINTHMLVRLGILVGTVGIAMTVVGAVLLHRFLRVFPPTHGTTPPDSCRQFSR